MECGDLVKTVGTFVALAVRSLPPRGSSTGAGGWGRCGADKYRRREEVCAVDELISKGEKYLWGVRGKQVRKRRNL